MEVTEQQESSIIIKQMFISESKIGRDENKDVRYACGFIFVATDQV